MYQTMQNAAWVARFKNTFPSSVRYMVLSALGFALMGACVKEVSTYGIPVLEIVAARAIVSLVLSYLVVQRKNISIWGNNKGLLVARGVAGTVALMTLYYAVTTLPLAEATILQYLHPVFTAIFALIFLKEAVQRSTLLCIGFCITGLIIMVKPSLFVASTVELPMLSVAAAVFGALVSGIAYTLVKRLSKCEDSSVIIFYFPLIALPISVVMLGNDFVMPTLYGFVLLLFVGIFTQLGQIGLTKAMQSASASKATAYSYVQVIFSIALGWAYFSEVPSIWTWIGGGLILIGAMINTFWKR